MDRKGFTLIEMLGCLAVLCLVLCIGLYVTRDTLATTLSTLTGVSENQIAEAAQLYILENKTNWINDKEEYTCLTVQQLVDFGYFADEDVVSYKDKKIRIVRNSTTKVVEKVNLVDVCE